MNGCVLENFVSSNTGSDDGRERMIRRLLWTLAVANKPSAAKTSQCSHRTCADPCQSKNVVSKQGRVHINETLRNGPPACRTACVGCGACRDCSTASSIGAAACSEKHLNAVGSARDSQEAGNR